MLNRSSSTFGHLQFEPIDQHLALEQLLVGKVWGETHGLSDPEAIFLVERVSEVVGERGLLDGRELLLRVDEDVFLFLGLGLSLLLFLEYFLVLVLLVPPLCLSLLPDS